jgi:hypothetical protein
MIQLLFEGWFQCRLATDPDPSDEPRGVSGYMKALPGEPDLDRIIRLQPPFFRRSYTPEVGVVVREVVIDGVSDKASPYISAEINLLDDPIFKGENGVVAEDGAEPIVPFVLEVRKGSEAVSRRCPASKEFIEFPFVGLQSIGILRDPAAIAAATGITDIKEHITERRQKMEEDLKTEKDETVSDNLRRRIAFLQTPSAIGFFPFMMKYRVPLTGEVFATGSLNDLKDLARKDSFDWIVDFWMGGWDADAASGYVKGHIELGKKNPYI